MDNLIIGKRPDLYDDSDSDSYGGYDSSDSEYSGPRDMSVVISDLEELKEAMCNMMMKIEQLDSRKPPGMISPVKPKITSSSLKLDGDEFGFNSIKFDTKKKKQTTKETTVDAITPPAKPAPKKATMKPVQKKTPVAKQVIKKTVVDKSTDDKKAKAKPLVKKETSADKKAKLKKHMADRAAEAAARK